MKILVRPGVYLVIEAVHGIGLRTYAVGKDKTCSCGGTARRPCRHIKAVAEYLKNGGERAPEPRPTKPKFSLPPTAAVPTTCPVCGGEVQVLAPYGPKPLWRCLNSNLHYWQWRGEQGVRAFLTSRDHPNKVGAFYRQSLQERTAFLAAARQRMFADGYSPFV
jgi:hypothetical protein